MKRWTDHKGRRFSSFAAMCYWWAITPRTVKNRLNKGQTLHDALELSWNKSIPARDHEGHTFASLTAMAKAWGIGFKAFHHRLTRGWSIKRALTTAVRARRIAYQKNRTPVKNETN